MSNLHGSDVKFQLDVGASTWTALDFEISSSMDDGGNASSAVNKTNIGAAAADYAPGAPVTGTVRFHLDAASTDTAYEKAVTDKAAQTKTPVRFRESTGTHSTYTGNVVWTTFRRIAEGSDYYILELNWQWDGAPTKATTS